jgi:hypothetical protein
MEESGHALTLLSTQISKGQSDGSSQSLKCSSLYGILLKIKDF